MKNKIKSIIFWLLSPICFRHGARHSIYLTYDDGPHPDNTPEILATLKKHRVKATFFMIGQWMETYPDLVRQAINDGHTIGYHAYRHKSLKNTSFRQLRKDIHQVRKLEKMFNHKIRLYRPPFGDLTLSGIVLWALSGRKIVLWNLDSRDSFDSYDEILRNLKLKRLLGGEIVLFHDDYKYAGPLLDEVLCELANSNFKIALL